MPDLPDTIFGEMTYPGRSALRAVRVSGSLARKITGKLFKSKTDPWKTPRNAVNGILNTLDGLAVDSIVAIAFKAPHSFTGQDCIEFHCHGSEGVVRVLSSSLASLGARKALPGEFSYRAFLAGKLNAGESESLGNLIAAETEIEARAAGIANSGAAQKKILLLRDKIVSLRAKWEARIDFPDDVPQPGNIAWKKELAAVAGEAGAVSSLAKRSRPAREGFRVAIFGAPNSGKSSLFNSLLGRERAIVTPHPGTTRDIIEEKLDIDGIPMVFQDMAGARKKGRKIENEGISRALQSAKKADAVLFLFDGSKGWRASDAEAYNLLEKKPLFLVAAKKDLYGKRKFRIRGKVHEISNKTGAGIDKLIKSISGWGKKNLPVESLFLISRRQEECLANVERALSEAEKALSTGGNELHAAESVREALREADKLTLRSSSEEMYDLIFSGFCIGK